MLPTQQDGYNGLMFNSHPRRPLLAAVLVFLLACIAAATLIWHLDQRERQERRARVANLAAARVDVLQRIIERGLSASYALAALVRQGKGAIPNFDAVAGEMLQFYPAVSELALAPEGVIRDIVPLAGNEKALGIDLLKDPAQRSEALRARDTAKPILAGPLELVQGGQGLVGRFPVYLDGAEGKSVFWGFALVVMRVPEVLDTVNLPQLAEWGFAYALWRIHPDTGQKQIIAASSNAALAEPIERALHVPNATWTLSLAPLAGWGNPQELALEAALGLLFSLLLAYLAKVLLELRAHRKGLEALVGERTAELREREARFRSLTEMSSDFYWESGADHRLTQLVTGNKEDPALILPSGSPLGKPRWEVPYLTPDEAGWEAHRARLDAHLPFRDFEYSRLAVDGVVRHISISGDPVFDASGAFQGYRGVGKDISERKAIEAKIARMAQLYAALSQCNQAIVRCASEDELFPQICRDTVQFGGMKSVRISLLDPDTRMVRAAASAGFGVDDVEDVMVSTDTDSPYGRGPTGTAIRENRPVWCQDFMNDPATAPWRERGARVGWGAVAALPLHREGVVVGALIVFDGEVNAFDEARRGLFVEMASDISYALDNFERESRRKQAEEELRQSEARFRSLTEMSSDFYWETDAEHRLTQRSVGSRHNALNVLEYDEWQGRRRWEIPYLAPDESGWRAHRTVLDAHLPLRNFEFSRHGSDGSTRHFLINGDPVFNTSGEFRGYRGVGTDITGRKAAEQALAESEARFRSLTEMSSDFYWGSDAEHRLTARDSANKKLSTVSAFQRGTQIGESRWDIPYLSPDAAGWEAHRAVLDAHLLFRNFELSRRGADGSERFISISGDPMFDASGTFHGYRGVGTDITERKRAESAVRASEQRLRLALNSAAMAAWEWSIEPDSLTWGEHPGWLIGPEPAGGYPDFRELVHPEDRAAFLHASQQAIAQGTNYYAVFRIVRTDGIVRWIEAQGVFLEAQGSQRGERVIGVSRDITGSKQRQDELRRLNEELEQRVAERTQALEATNDELEAFSYSVSHDLRAPLRTIDGFSRVLEKEYAGRIDEQGRDMLRRLSAGAQKMGLLIDDLLKLSRISRQEMRIEPVDLSALAREVVDELQMGEPERRVEWIIAPQVSARGDAGLLRVALQNLIGNAWKYSSRRDAARIEFGVVEKDGKSDYFVRDNDAGFDMADAKKLFGAFQRLHTEAEFPGSGIGLATVARILHRHGGKAWVEARPGEGATFHFSLG